MLSAIAIALAIWAIILVFVSKFLDAPALLTVGISVASSMVVVGVAVYGIGSWRNQAGHRVRHDIACTAIEASLEALEKLSFARNTLTDQITSFRAAQERDEPWEPDDKNRLREKIDGVDEALKHLRTAHQLVRIHLDDRSETAMRKLVDLGREYTRTTNLHFRGADTQLPDEEFKRRQRVLFDYKDNSFSQELESAQDDLIEALQPFLLSK